MAGHLCIEYPNFSGQVTGSGTPNRNPGAHLFETCSWRGTLMSNIGLFLWF